jgi:acetyl esterase
MMDLTRKPLLVWLGLVASSIAGDVAARVSPVLTEANIPAEAKRSVLDPELAEWLKVCPRLGAHEPIEDARRAHYALVPKDPPPIGRVENIAVPCEQGTVTVRVYHPTGEENVGSPALIYLHGGGWTVGAVDQFEGAMRIFAEEGKIQVYAVEYRLAPEFRYPTQLGESESVLRHLVAHARELKVDPDRIAIGGDSAGGNMSAVLSQMMRDRKGPKLALQVLLYPECKLPFETKAGRENHSGYYLETSGVFLFAWNYVPEGVDSSIPYITPVNAKELSGLPPAYVVTNGFDPLRDTGHEYAQLLAKAGNKVHYVNHEAFTHGFIQFTEKSKKCLAATREIGRDVGRLLRGRPID